MSNGRLIAISAQVGIHAIEPLQPFLDIRLTDTNVIEIVQRALELDTEMSKQKAALYFSYLGYFFQYDLETMNIVPEQYDVDTAPRSSWDVDVLVAPALCKNDIFDGEIDVTYSILMAAEVLCSSQRAHRTASPQHKHSA